MDDREPTVENSPGCNHRGRAGPQR